jgi:sugar O-acyltransferase (sialic acid O-acetyltransferase NeuD family)
MRPLVLWGGTGQAIVLGDFAADLGCEVVAVIDRDSGLDSPFEGVPVFCETESLMDYLWHAGKADACFAVAIGGSGGQDRCRLSAVLKDLGLAPLAAVHKRAWIAGSAVAGEGVQVMANASVGTRARLGRQVIVNTAAVIDHECELGDGVHIGPGAVLAGLVGVGDYSFIGAGAVILPRVRIGRNSIIGAGTVVTKDIPDNVVCAGVPARILRANMVDGNE